MKAYFQQLEQAMAQTPSFDGQTATLIHFDQREWYDGVVYGYRCDMVELHITGKW